VQTGVSVNRFAGLDHLRALAVIIVVLFHYGIFAHPPGLSDVGAFGWTGVDLFFVLSGFLIGGQLFSKLAKEEPISYGEFYFKRSLRIIPAYLFVVALYFAFPGFKERSELPPLWRFLTFTQNLGLDIKLRGAFSHAWSLCIEEQFYLFLPLFIIGLAAMKAHKKAVWLLPALFVFGFAARLASWYFLVAPKEGTAGFGIAYYRYIYYPTYTRLDGLLAGLALAAIYHFQPAGWQRITRHGNKILGISLLLLAGLWWANQNEYQYAFSGAIFGYPLLSLAYGLLVLAALSPSCILYRYSSRFTSLIATLSYSIYLTHKQLIHLTQDVLGKYGIDKDSYTAFWIAIGISFLGGWLLHRLIEKPFLRLRDRLLARSKKRALLPAGETAPAQTTP
jgi:peptidoglycan/LPS O-acetylase OafA/YrhL